MRNNNSYVIRNRASSYTLNKRRVMNQMFERGAYLLDLDENGHVRASRDNYMGDFDQKHDDLGEFKLSPEQARAGRRQMAAGKVAVAAESSRYQVPELKPVKVEKKPVVKPAKTERRSSMPELNVPELKLADETVEPVEMPESMKRVVANAEQAEAKQPKHAKVEDAASFDELRKMSSEDFYNYVNNLIARYNNEHAEGQSVTAKHAAENVAPVNAKHAKQEQPAQPEADDKTAEKREADKQDVQNLLDNLAKRNAKADAEAKAVAAAAETNAKPAAQVVEPEQSLDDAMNDFAYEYDGGDEERMGFWRRAWEKIRSKFGRKHYDDEADEPADVEEEKPKHRWARRLAVGALAVVTALGICVGVKSCSDNRNNQPTVETTVNWNNNTKGETELDKKTEAKERKAKQEKTKADTKAEVKANTTNTANTEANANTDNKFIDRAAKEMGLSSEKVQQLAGYYGIKPSELGTSAGEAKMRDQMSNGLNLNEQMQANGDANAFRDEYIFVTYNNPMVRAQIAAALDEDQTPDAGLDGMEDGSVLMNQKLNQYNAAPTAHQDFDRVRNYIRNANVTVRPAVAQRAYSVFYNGQMYIGNPTENDGGTNQWIYRMDNGSTQVEIKNLCAQLNVPDAAPAPKPRVYEYVVRHDNPTPKPAPTPDKPAPTPEPTPTPVPTPEPTPTPTPEPTPTPTPTPTPKLEPKKPEESSLLKGNNQTAMRPPVVDTPPKYVPYTPSKPEAPKPVENSKPVDPEEDPHKWDNHYVDPQGNIKPIENHGDKFVPAPTDDHGNIGSYQEERPDDTAR